MKGTETVLQLSRWEGEDVQVKVCQRDLPMRKRSIKTWSNEEDELLLEVYDMHPKKWTMISSLMPGRNENQCLHRYRRLSQLGRQRKIWSKQEDEMVKKMIKKVGRNWKLLADMLGTKTGKQIRERYINKLDPYIKKDEWSQEEDISLIKLYSQYGSRWSEIAKMLPGRPENRIKNRFYSHIKRRYKIVEFTPKNQSKIKANDIYEDAHSSVDTVPEHTLQSCSHKLGHEIFLESLEEPQSMKKELQSHPLIQGTEMLIREFMQTGDGTRQMMTICPSLGDLDVLMLNEAETHPLQELCFKEII